MDGVRGVWNKPVPSICGNDMYKGVLLDLGGVVYIGDGALPGAIDSIARLRSAGLGVRFITNVTRQSRRSLLAKLGSLGIDIDPVELFMPLVPENSPSTDPRASSVVRPLAWPEPTMHSFPRAPMPAISRRTSDGGCTRVQMARWPRFIAVHTHRN